MFLENRASSKLAYKGIKKVSIIQSEAQKKLLCFYYKCHIHNDFIWLLAKKGN